MQQQHTAPAPAIWRHLPWLALLVAASMAFSLGLACAVPFAAFAAAAALTLSQRNALLLILFVWLANQLVGFAVLGYPWTASTFAWGAVLGVTAILATLAGGWAAARLIDASRVVGSAATFLIAFALYEAVLFAASVALLGGAEIYTMAIQGRIFAINAIAFAALVAMSRLAVSVRLIANPQVAVSMTERHA